MNRLKTEPGITRHGEHIDAMSCELIDTASGGVK